VVKPVGEDFHAWNARRDMVKANEGVHEIEREHGLTRRKAQPKAPGSAGDTYSTDSPRSRRWLPGIATHLQDTNFGYVQEAAQRALRTCPRSATFVRSSAPRLPSKM